MNMKKIVAIIMMVAIVSAASAQQPGALSKFFSKYSGDERFMEVKISPKMFSLITNMDVETPEDKETIDAISKLKGLTVLRGEEGVDSRALYKEAISLVPKDYEELMSVRDKDVDMKFFIKETSPGKISELLMVSGGMKEFTTMSLVGEIDLKTISRIGRKMEVDGLDKLEKLHDNHDKKN